MLPDFLLHPKSSRICSLDESENLMAKHILVVDDDALLRRSLSLQLEQAGYRASTAASAEDALALIQRDQPDLILLDVGLPGMDGLEALRHIQQENDIPVIFVTARRRELDTILGLELGADGYITKPFNPDVLLAHVKSVLRRTARQTAPLAASDMLTVGDMSIDPAAHTVDVAGTGGRIDRPRIRPPAHPGPGSRAGYSRGRSHHPRLGCGIHGRTAGRLRAYSLAA